MFLEVSGSVEAILLSDTTAPISRYGHVRFGDPHQVDLLVYSKEVSPGNLLFLRLEVGAVPVSRVIVHGAPNMF